jgi:rod shape-determining protein MreD
MRSLKLALLIVALLTLQTTVLPRLSFLGVTPNVVLVAVVIVAVLGKREEAVIFAALAGLGQDLLSRGGYWQTVGSVLISALITNFRAELRGDSYALAAGLVVLLTPLLLLVEFGALLFFQGRGVSLAYVALLLTAGTIYNLLFVPILYPLLREITGAE